MYYSQWIQQNTQTLNQVQRIAESGRAIVNDILRGGNIERTEMIFINNTIRPTILSMSEVEEKEPEWLVPQYMPKGQINTFGRRRRIWKKLLFGALWQQRSVAEIRCSLTRLLQILLNAIHKRY